MITIVLVDDHHVVRQGFKSLLESEMKIAGRGVSPAVARQRMVIDYASRFKGTTDLGGWRGMDFTAERLCSHNTNATRRLAVLFGERRLTLLLPLACAAYWRY